MARAPPGGRAARRPVRPRVMAVLEEIESDASLQGPVVSSESSPVTSSVRHRGRPVVPDDPDGTSSLDEWLSLIHI